MGISLENMQSIHTPCSFKLHHKFLYAKKMHDDLQITNRKYWKKIKSKGKIRLATFANNLGQNGSKIDWFVSIDFVHCNCRQNIVRILKETNCISARCLEILKKSTKCENKLSTNLSKKSDYIHFRRKWFSQIDGNIKIGRKNSFLK